MPYTNTILYLTEEEVQKTITVAEGVALADKGIRADAEGKVAGDKFYTSISDQGFIKPFTGYIEGEEYFFVKTFGFFGDNPEKFGQPTTTSLVLLFDAETGLPVCLMEAGWVTGLKTGSSTAVTASMLARSNSKNTAIFGAGLQGRMHIRALAEKFDLERVSLFDILPEVAVQTAGDLSDELDIAVEASSLDQREEIIREADMVFTVTTGSQILVERTWLKPGSFIAKLGSYVEIDNEVITGVDKVVVDNWYYVSPRILELQQLIQEGNFSFDDVHAEWPDIVGGRKPGRESQDEIITYIALGIWGEYAAILPEVYRKALSMGLGTRLPNSQVVKHG